MRSPGPSPGSLDEQALVERARDDVEAFVEIYTRYVDRIHRYAYRRCGSVDIAEDITSATFERALAGLARFRWRSGGLAPWLYRIAANELTDHFRRQGRRTGDRAQRAVDRLHDRSMVDDLSAIDAAADVDRLRAALDALNPRYQRALTLRYLADLDHEEAARAMGVTKGVMSVLVHRATAALTRELGREGGEPS